MNPDLGFTRVIITLDGGSTDEVIIPLSLDNCFKGIESAERENIPLFSVLDTSGTQYIYPRSKILRIKLVDYSKEVFKEFVEKQ